MERRLTTILTADVAGYSRLMEADEQGTFLALQFHLDEFVKPQIAFQNGRLIKLMGDGVLAEFSSVVDAVTCALDIQKKISANRSPQAEGGQIAWRIGIHLGDVIAQGEDIHGDGVNVAARLEGLAAPGAICISRQVLDQVANHFDVQWHDLGECTVKNISRPIHAFSTVYAKNAFVSAPKSETASRRLIALGIVLAIALAGIAYWKPWIGFNPTSRVDASVRHAAMLPSLAILPFESLSDDANQDYLADGITDDLITDLARVSGLVVIARNSSFAFKGGSSDLHEIAEELDARYIVLGSLRQSGDRIRINAQLVDTVTGTNIWADRYDRETSDIFALQDDVRSKIVEALKVKLTPEEAQQLSASLTDSTEAYDAYLRARQQESYFTRDSTRSAIRYYHEALEIDPEFTTAKARLATAYTIAVEAGWTEDPEISLELARSLAKEAIAQDGNLPLAHWALARVYTRKEFFDGEKALESLRRAIEIDPNYADGHAMLANTLHFVGKAEEGLSHIETAMRLNPRFPFWYYFALGANQFHLTRFEAAEASFLKSIDRNPRWRANHLYLVSTYGHLERVEDAEWEMDELRALGFDPTMSNWREIDKHQDAAYHERFFEGLRKAGVPES
ncbi:MAG: adenylate/guanylate cyclase domain-containing protein [Ruegeria sp.]